MESYNARIISFPDGTQRLHYSSKSYEVKSPEEKEFVRRCNKDWKEYQQYLMEVDFDMYFALFGSVEESKVDYDSERERLLYMKRAKQRVYDIARSNLFTHFINLTFNPDKVDSFNYEECTKSLLSFTKLLKRHGCSYILVPEKHKSGRYHFHGLITLGSLRLVRAISVYTGLEMTDKQGRPIYNLPQFSLGFSQATEVSDPARCASYLGKYLTKELQVPKGKKCYWASRSCSRPVVERCNLSEDELAPYVENARFVKVTNNDYGDFLIAEKERV